MTADFPEVGRGKLPSTGDAPAKPGRDDRKAWSKDLSQADVLPGMVELASGLRLFPEKLPTGVIVGSAVIDHSTLRHGGMYQWHLTDVVRANRLRKPDGQPLLVWFTPF